MLLLSDGYSKLGGIHVDTHRSLSNDLIGGGPNVPSWLLRKFMLHWWVRGSHRSSVIASQCPLVPSGTISSRHARPPHTLREVTVPSSVIVTLGCAKGSGACVIWVCQVPSPKSKSKSCWPSRNGPVWAVADCAARVARRYSAVAHLKVNRVPWLTLWQCLVPCVSAAIVVSLDAIFCGRSCYSANLSEYPQPIEQWDEWYYSAFSRPPPPR
jgi:hypothetical protein